MRDVLTFIMAGGKGERLFPLTKDRAKPAVPFGGIYRIIDFTLSNCINSGIRKIHILTQYKSFSLQRHVRMGWNIFNSELGEYIDMIPAQQRIDEHWYLGTADAVYQNLYAIDNERPDVVLVLAGDHVYKMNYADMVQAHHERRAEVTIGVIEMSREQASRFGVIEVDSLGRVIGFQEKPKDPKTIPGDPRGSCFASMGIYLFDRKLLQEVLIEDAQREGSTRDFGRDVLPNIIQHSRVMAYTFQDENKKSAKYWRDIGTLDAYYEANMDLVQVTPQFNLYDRDWPIRTYQEQWPPAKTVFADETSGRIGVVLDSIISSGCIVSGGKIHNSVLSPNVRVNSYADVQGSILMESVDVGRHAKIRRAIIDKDVVIPRHVQIGYDLDEDRRRGFHVTDNGIVVVPKGTVIEESAPAVSLAGV